MEDNNENTAQEAQKDAELSQELTTNFFEAHLDNSHVTDSSLLEVGAYIQQANISGVVTKIMPKGAIINVLRDDFGRGIEIEQDFVKTKNISNFYLPKNEKSAESILQAVKIKVRGLELWEMPHNEFLYCIGSYLDYPNNVAILKDCYNRILYVVPLKDRKTFFSEEFTRKIRIQIVQEAMLNGKPIPAKVLNELGINSETLPTQTEKPTGKAGAEITWQLAYQRYKSAKSPTGKKKYENIILEAVRAGEPIPNNVLGELDSEKVQEAMQSFINLPTTQVQPAGKVQMSIQDRIKNLENIYKIDKDSKIKIRIKHLKNISKI